MAVLPGRYEWGGAFFPLAGVAWAAALVGLAQQLRTRGPATNA
jgi:hypothetical protein